MRGLPQIRGCPRNCERRAESRLPLGIACPGRRHEATTREPGDLPSQTSSSKPGGCPGRGAWFWKFERVPLEMNAASEAAGSLGCRCLPLIRAASRFWSAAPAAIRPARMPSRVPAGCLPPPTRDAAAPHGIRSPRSNASATASAGCRPRCSNPAPGATCSATSPTDSGADLVGRRPPVRHVRRRPAALARPAGQLKRGLVARIPPLAIIGTQS